MSETDRTYWNKSYEMTVEQKSDRLKVHKTAGSDWCDIALTINIDKRKFITLRSKEMAQQLHFMLGQLLHD